MGVLGFGNILANGLARFPSDFQEAQDFMQRQRAAQQALALGPMKLAIDQSNAAAQWGQIANAQEGHQIERDRLGESQRSALERERLEKTKLLAPPSIAPYMGQQVGQMLGLPGEYTKTLVQAQQAARDQALRNAVQKSGATAGAAASARDAVLTRARQNEWATNERLAGRTGEIPQQEPGQVFRPPPQGRLVSEQMTQARNVASLDKAALARLPKKVAAMGGMVDPADFRAAGVSLSRLHGGPLSPESVADFLGVPDALRPQLWSDIGYTPSPANPAQP